MNFAGRPLLEVRGMSAGYYAGHNVVTDVNLEVGQGEIVCIIGPNGAGKSTVFKAIYGLAEVRSGQVLCDGRDITNIAPQDALRTAGMAMVPQLRSVFSQMTVYENLELGMFVERDKARVRERIEYVYGLFPKLAQRSRQAAGTMSGGEQRMLEIGRALMHEPRLVLMDEPSVGLAPIVTHQVFEAIRRLNLRHRPDGADDRAERPPRTRSEPPGLRAGARTEQLPGSRRGTTRQSRGTPRLPGYAMNR